MHSISIILLGLTLIVVSMTNMIQDEKIEDLSTRLEVLETGK